MNDKVDDLLVGVLKQIRFNEKHIQLAVQVRQPNVQSVENLFSRSAQMIRNYLEIDWTSSSDKDKQHNQNSENYRAEEKGYYSFGIKLKIVI